MIIIIMKEHLILDAYACRSQALEQKWHRQSGKAQEEEEPEAVGDGRHKYA